MAQYTVEVYEPDGTFVADISRIATEKKVTAELNGAGSITFKVDPTQLKALADEYESTPAQLLGVGKNEVRIRRNDEYLRQGGQIANITPSYDDPGLGMEVQVIGFLDLLASRYYEKQKVHSGVQVSTILWTAINEMQTASTNFWVATVPTAARATFGITRGNNPTIATKDRTYESGKSVKDILVQMTEVQTTDTDIEIDHEKVFNVYERMGQDKPEIVFEEGVNFATYSAPYDTTALANRVLTLGDNNSVQRMVQDTASQDTYKVRQHFQQFNSATENDTLDDHGRGYLAAAKDPLNVPDITVDLNGDVTIDDFWIGDSVTVRLSNPDLPYPIEGLYRIEQIELDITDENLESAKLTLSET